MSNEAQTCWAVFVGGSMDGTNQVFSGGKPPVRYGIPVCPPSTKLYGENEDLPPPEVLPYEFEQYLRQRLKSRNGGSLWLYKLGTITTEDMFCRLLQGYRQPKEQKNGY